MSTRRAKRRKEDNNIIIPYRKWLNVYNEKGFYNKFLRQFENLGRPRKFRKRAYKREKILEMKTRAKEAYEVYVKYRLVNEHSLNQNAIIELVGWGK